MHGPPAPGQPRLPPIRARTIEASAALHPFAHPELSISSIAAHEAGGAEPKQPSTHGGNELALSELPNPIELTAGVASCAPPFGIVAASNFRAEPALPDPSPRPLRGPSGPEMESEMQRHKRGKSLPFVGIGFNPRVLI